MWIICVYRCQNWRTLQHCSVLEGNLDDTCNQQRMYQSTGDNQELPQELTYNVQAAKQYKMTIVLWNKNKYNVKDIFLRRGHGTLLRWSTHSVHKYPLIYKLFVEITQQPGHQVFILWLIAKSNGCNCDWLMTVSLNTKY